MKQEAVLQSNGMHHHFLFKALWHFPYSFPILICMFPNNCLGLWPQSYLQKSSFYGFKNNTTTNKNYWTTAVLKQQNKLCISETSVTQMKTHPYGPSNTKSEEMQKIRSDMIDRGSVAETRKHSVILSKDQECGWVPWFWLSLWEMHSWAITPLSFSTWSNLTKWERNHHRGLLGIHLFPHVCFLTSRGLPLSLSPQRPSPSSFLPVSCIVCQICLIWIRRNNCFMNSALTDLHRYGHPRDNETLTDLLVAKV